MIETIETAPEKQRRIKLSELKPKRIQTTSVVEVGKEAFGEFGWPCICNCFAYNGPICVFACFHICDCDLDPWWYKNIEILGDYAYRAVFNVSYEIAETIGNETTKVNERQNVVTQRSQVVLEVDKAVEKAFTEKGIGKGALVKQGTMANGNTQYLVRLGNQANKSMV